MLHFMCLTLWCLVDFTRNCSVERLLRLRGDSKIEEHRSRRPKSRGESGTDYLGAL